MTAPPGGSRSGQGGPVETADWFQLIAGPALLLRFSDGVVVEFNAAARRLFGFECGEVEGRCFSDLAVSSGEAGHWRALQRVVNLEGRFRAEGMHLRTLGGALQRVDVHAELIDAEGERRVLMFLQPILAPPAALPPDNENKAELVQHAAVGLYRLDTEGYLTDANPALAELLGYESTVDLLAQQTEFRARLYANPTHADELAATLAREGRVQHHKVQIRRRDGNRVWVAETVRAVRDAQGRRVAEVGTFSEISSELAAEHALAESEDKYRSLVEHSQDGVFVIRNGLYVYVNQAYAAMLGYTPEEMIGENFLRFFAPEERQKIVDMWRERQAGNWEQKAYEIYLLGKDGKTRVLTSVRSGPIHYAGEMASTGTVRDITVYRDTEHQLKLAEKRFRDIVEHAVIGIYQSTADGRLLSANPALARILGYESVAELKANVSNLGALYIDEAERKRLIAKLEAEGLVQGSELRLRHRDGMELWVQDNARVVYDETGAVICYEGMVEDITVRKLVEQALYRSEQLFRTLVENTHVGVMLVRDGTVSYANRAMTSMLDYPESGLAGQSLAALFAPETSDCVEDIQYAADASATPRLYEASLLAIDGVRRAKANLSVSTVSLEDAPVTILTVQDLSREKRAESRLRRLATHDPLTDLPNRTLLRARLVEMLAETHEKGNTDWAVLFLDLDAFKRVNDSLGHEAGDELLVELANRLLRAVRPGDLVCHHGGDEFVILANNVPHEADVVELAERIEAALAVPFRVDEHEIYNQATIGIALGRREYEMPEEVLRDADSAMAAGKRLGKVCHVVFNSSIHVTAMRRLETEAALRTGLSRGEFDCHFQPIVDARRNRVESFEALLRWHHPEHGLLKPRAFLQVAEETGLIVPLGWRGLTLALAACREWQEHAGGSPIGVAVNLADAQFRLPQLPDRIAHALEQVQMPPESLHLEVTERVFVETPALARRTLNRLHAMGVRLYLDDFGTGYSALSYLRELPFDALKIDRSFIAALPHDTRTASIVRNIISLANDLDLTVVAEGIEYPEQARILTDMGCHLFQGHFYGEAVSREQSLKLIDNDRRAPAVQPMR